MVVLARGYPYTDYTNYTNYTDYTPYTRYTKNPGNKEESQAFRPGILVVATGLEPVTPSM